MNRRLLIIGLLVVLLGSMLFVASGVQATTYMYEETWNDAVFTLSVIAAETWMLPEPYIINVTLQLTDPGPNDYIWIDDIEVSVSDVEAHVNVNTTLSSPGDAYSTLIRLEQGSGLAYVEPGETDRYRLFLAVHGTYKDTRLGLDLSTHSYEAIFISVTAPSRSPCVIATATYETEISPQVQFLRTFRDHHVLTTFAGRHFMTAFHTVYYSFSPRLAATITMHEPLRQVMKGVLYPLLGVLHVSEGVFTALRWIPEVGIVMAGGVASTLIALLYCVPIAILIGYLTKYTPSRRLLALIGYLVGGSLIAMTVAELLQSPLLMLGSSSLFVVAILSGTTLWISRRVLQRWIES